jgi:hypothetical protein
MKTRMKNLLAIREFLLHQDNIKMLSVAGNGVIKIAYDASLVSVEEATGIMSECGVSSFCVALDWRANAVFVTINPVRL